MGEGGWENRQVKCPISDSCDLCSQWLFLFQFSPRFTAEVPHLRSCLLPEVHDLLVLTCNIRYEMQPHHRFLHFENDCPKAKEILHDAILALLDILHHPEINTQMVIECDERFLDAVDLLICHNHHIEKIAVEADKEFEIHKDKEQRQKRERQAAREIIFNERHEEYGVSDAKDHRVPQKEFCDWPKHAYPVLVKLELKRLSSILSLEIKIAQP